MRLRSAARSAALLCGHRAGHELPSCSGWTAEAELTLVEILHEDPLRERDGRDVPLLEEPAVELLLGVCSHHRGALVQECERGAVVQYAGDAEALLLATRQRLLPAPLGEPSLLLA